MSESFRAAKLARKSQQKWWKHHIPLAYALVASVFLTVCLSVAFVDRYVTRSLATFGVSQSAVNLLFGAVSCLLGVWGLRSRRGLGTASVVVFTLCLLSGIVTLATAFWFF